MMKLNPIKQQSNPHNKTDKPSQETRFRIVLKPTIKTDKPPQEIRFRIILYPTMSSSQSNREGNKSVAVIW